MNFQSYCGYLVRRFLVILPLLSYTVLARAQSKIVPNAPITGYHLTFDDEFNTLSASSDPYLHHTLWCTCSWWYPAQGTANLSVANGMLSMKVNKKADGTFSTAALSTWSPSTHGFSQKFGYFEVRFKPAGQEGVLADFYLISEKDITTAGAYPTDEMDVFEKPKGDILYLTVHNGTANNEFRWNEISVPADFDQSFHTLGLLWEEHSGMIQWYLDGKFIFAAAKFNDTDIAPMVMTLEATVNGAIQPPDNTTATSSTVLVDYVRVFSNDPSIPLWTTEQ
jgi:beta-glucanase (GH16 family)